MRIHLWGTDFRRSTAEMRQRLFLPLEERAAVLARLREVSGFQDLVYLHTCNRVEFYTTGKDLFADSRPQWLAVLRELGLSADDYYRGFHLEGKSAVRHMLRVACSLESLVVGEPQILGQLKEAVRFSKEHSLGPTESTDRLFSFVFQTAKSVRAETTIGERPVSVASLGLRHLEAHANAIPLQRVVLVGRSPMCLTILQWLRKNAPGTPITWVNRSVEALAAMPESAGTEHRSLADFLATPGEFSHLFTATSSREALFGEEFFRKFSAGARLFYDFAEPPDITAEAVGNAGTLIALPDLEAQAEANASARELAVLEAEARIDVALREYVQTRKESPWLRQFSGLEPELEKELLAALDRLPTQLSDNDRKHVSSWAQKLLRRSFHTSREHLRKLLREVAEDSKNSEAS